MTTTDPDEYARQLATESLAVDDSTGWFEQLYVAADEGRAVVPWDRGMPNRFLVEWGRTRQPDGIGRALVVGCGLGDDAELIASLGYQTVGFDIAATAIRSARQRFPDSPVDYRTADVLAPPADWAGAFDLVVESMTVQSLPPPAHPSAIAHVAGFVAPGGRLVVHAMARRDDGVIDAAPPWPLSRAEMQAFATAELHLVRLDEIHEMMPAPTRRWRAELRRDATS